jgi:hypothetical protein
MTVGFLQREAEALAPKSIVKQLRRSPSPPLSPPQSPDLDNSSNGASPVEELQTPRERRESMWSTLTTAVNASRKLAKSKGPANSWKVEVY